MPATRGPTLVRLKQRYWAYREQARRFWNGVLRPLGGALALPLARARWSDVRAAPIRPNHLLMLAWHFPPATNGGVFRPLSFARYAQDHQWSMQVVCEAVPPRQWEAGRSLLARLPEGLRVTRLQDQRSRVPLDFLPRIDGGLANLTFALTRLHEELRGQPRPSLILASGPPFFNFPLARLLSNLIGVPYVIEYRDEWSLCPHDFVEVGWLDRLAERWSLAGAAHVAFATRAKLEHCLRCYPVFKRDQASVVPNGWDPELVAVQPPSGDSAAVAAQRGRALRLVFAGTLASHADPGPFLATLARLLEAEPAWRDRLKVEFIGHKESAQQALLDGFPFPGVVESTAMLAQAAARSRMLAADILLVFNPPDMHRYLPGKLLEYLAVPRPVLLYGAGGEMEDLLLRARSGVAVTEGDPQSLSQALAALAGWHDAADPQRQVVVQSLRRDTIAGHYFSLLSSLQASPT